MRALYRLILDIQYLGLLLYRYGAAELFARYAIGLQSDWCLQRLHRPVKEKLLLLKKVLRNTLAFYLPEGEYAAVFFVWL